MCHGSNLTGAQQLPEQLKPRRESPFTENWHFNDSFDLQSNFQLLLLVASMRQSQAPHSQSDGNGARQRIAICG
jgi:hypothetical protein